MSGTRCTVSIADSGLSFSCEGVTILDSAIAQGIQLPYNCRGGACGTCKADVLEGSVQHGLVMGFAISDEEIAQGKCLICSSRPLTEHLVLRMHNKIPRASGGAIVAQEHEADIVAVYDIAESVRRVTARLRDPGALRFDGGMYMEFMLEGVDPPRPYSIATTVDHDGSTPDGLLDFLIARHDHGVCSTHIHTDLRVGTPLVLRGPYGTFRLPEPAHGRLLMLAGGTGLAPLISIAAQQLTRGYSGEMDLFFSVRTPQHVFLLDELHRLAYRHPGFRFRVFVTRAGSQEIPADWEKRRITDYLREARPRLDAQVLIAGAPGFVRDCEALIREAGVPGEAILLESYEVRR